MDANKLIDNMTARYAQKVAALEKEAAVLVTENQALKEEIEHLKQKETESVEEM